MALPKKNRLSRVDKNINKKIYDGPFFRVFAKERDDTSRFAFVISNKISKKATARNKIRRYLQESIRELLTKFPSGDYVFYVKKGILDKNLGEIKDEVKQVYVKKLSTNSNTWL